MVKRKVMSTRSSRGSLESFSLFSRDLLFVLRSENCKFLLDQSHFDISKILGRSDVDVAKIHVLVLVPVVFLREPSYRQPSVP